MILLNLNFVGIFGSGMSPYRYTILQVGIHNAKIHILLYRQRCKVSQFADDASCNSQFFNYTFRVLLP